ncbi:MAG: hypothetical protein ABH808_00690 [Candidatus Kuenenbacteria bacterium]
MEEDVIKIVERGMKEKDKLWKGHKNERQDLGKYEEYKEYLLKKIEEIFKNYIKIKNKSNFIDNILITCKSELSFNFTDDLSEDFKIIKKEIESFKLFKKSIEESIEEIRKEFSKKMIQLDEALIRSIEETIFETLIKKITPLLMDVMEKIRKTSSKKIKIIDFCV